MSPHGNDLNTGTRQAPVLTLTQALKQAREWRRLSDPAIADGIHICLENGAYPLSEPIQRTVRTRESSQMLHLVTYYFTCKIS